MMPKWHFLYGTLFAVILYFLADFTLIATLIVFLASVFIDLDKAVLFTLKEKSLNPIRFWEQGKTKRKLWERRKSKKEYKHPLRFFHGVEALVVLAALSFLNSFFLWVFLGFFLHLCLDTIDYIYHDEDIFTKLSLTYTIVTNKNRKSFD